MGRRPRVDRTPEEKWQIVQEGIKSGTPRRRAGGMAFHRHCYIDGRTKRRREQRQRLGGKSAVAGETEKDQRARQLERTLGRVAWWLRRKEGLTVNRKRVLPVMRERGLLVRSRRLRARRRKEWGRVEAATPNQIWQSDMTKIWAGPAVGWA